jgi:hypothetical protein
MPHEGFTHLLGTHRKHVEVNLMRYTTSGVAFFTHSSATRGGTPREAHLLRGTHHQKVQLLRHASSTCGGTFEEVLPSPTRVGTSGEELTTNMWEENPANLVPQQQNQPSSTATKQRPSKRVPNSSWRKTLQGRLSATAHISPQARPEKKENWATQARNGCNQAKGLTPWVPGVEG